MPVRDPRWTAQLERLWAQLEAIDVALLAFIADGSIEEYEYDTGSTTQRVRRSEVGKLALMRDRLLIRIETLEGKVGRGCGVRRIRTW